MSSSSDSDQSEGEEDISNSIAQTQAPPLSIAVENSSDIKVGPHLQYNGPVTIKQYITVHSVENVAEISNAAPYHSSAALYKNALSPGAMDFSEPDILHKKERTNKSQDIEDKNQPLENPFSWKWMTSHFTRRQMISMVLVLGLLMAVLIALLIIYTGPDRSAQLELIGSSGLIDVPAGQDAQWEVQSKISHPLVFEWKNPKGEKLTKTLHPGKYRLWTSGNRTVVRVYDVTHNDSGTYVLRAYNLTAKSEQELKVNLRIYDAGTPAHGRMVVCYVATWASIRQGDGAFSINNIDPTLCTHLIYAFAIMNNNTIGSWHPDYDLEENGGKGSFKKMTALKEKHPKLKVMLAVGGWEDGALKYSKMANSPASRKAFITSVSEYLRKYNFDGLDLHWQYPVVSWRNEGHAQFEDKQNLVILLKEMREELDKYGLLLTMPLGMPSDILQESYDIPGISQHVHYMFAMCYAYHTHWEEKTGPSAPLYPINPDDTKNVESGISLLLRLGAPLEKLVLGIPLHGRLFLIADNYKGDIHFGVPAKQGVSISYKYVGEPGFWGYNEICEVLGYWSSTWKIVQDAATLTPYAYNIEEHKFLSYDDAESVAHKAKFAVETNLAGVMTWSIDTDDFRGRCSTVGTTQFPLMRAINKAIQEIVREQEERETDMSLNNNSTAFQLT